MSIINISSLRTYHATHGVDAPAVAGADEEVGVAPHEVLSHPHLNPVREEAVRLGLECLDVAEDVVPSSTVEPDGVLPQLVEDLIHLKHRRKGLDQDRSPDAPPSYSGQLLGPLEHPIPYLGLPACMSSIERHAYIYL